MVSRILPLLIDSFANNSLKSQCRLAESSMNLLVISRLYSNCDHAVHYYLAGNIYTPTKMLYSIAMFSKNGLVLLRLLDNPSITKETVQLILDGNYVDSTIIKKATKIMERL